MLAVRLVRELAKHACFFLWLIVVIILAALPERTVPRLAKRG